MSRGNSHVRVNGRGRGGTVGSSSWARVILRATPAQADTRVADRVALHLVDSHLSSVTLDELDKTTALSRRNLDIGDLAESLEERTELILGDVARKTSNKDGSIVGIGELVHGLGSAVETHRRTAHVGWVQASWTRHTHATTRTNAGTLVLGSSSGNAHGTVAAVNALHLTQSTLLVVLVREANEAIAARHATDGVGHDLGGLARREATLEERNEDVFVDFRSEITDKDRVFRSTLITASIGETTSSSPVEFECAGRVWHGGTVESKSLGGSGSGGEIDKAVTSIASTVNISPTSETGLKRYRTPKTCRESS